MLHNIVEIFEENRRLSLYRGFMSISSKEGHIANVPLSDIAVLMLSGQSITISKPLLAELAERNIVSIICGKNYAPVGFQIPVNGHYYQSAIIKMQITASQPFLKNIWKKIVEEKIKNQAKALSVIGNSGTSGKLKLIAGTVKSGDTDNREAYAARLYWSSLFSSSFKRDKDGDGLNSFLNYGYAIVRSSMIRAICASGLLPGLGVNHSNKLNPFCLADDFFEPFRPIVDIFVKNLEEEGYTEMVPETKQRISDILWVQLKTKEGKSPLFQALLYYAQSYVKCLKEKKPLIEIPLWEGKIEGVSPAEQVRDYVDDGAI